jgi:hypothetical protein
VTEIRNAAKACVMGRATEHPCPYPATEAIGGRRGGPPVLCAFHAATEPLVLEQEEMAVSLELVRDYLEAAREHPAAGPLVEALERLAAEYAGRFERVDGVMRDLQAAEFRLMRP